MVQRQYCGCQWLADSWWLSCHSRRRHVRHAYVFKTQNNRKIFTICTFQFSSIPSAGHLFRYVTNQPPKANSAVHPSGVGKWGPALAGKAKGGMVHSVSGWTRGVQVTLWDPLKTRAIPERLRGVFTTRCYANPRLPYLTFIVLQSSASIHHHRHWHVINVIIVVITAVITAITVVNIITIIITTIKWYSEQLNTRVIYQ